MTQSKGLICFRTLKLDVKQIISFLFLYKGDDEDAEGVEFVIWVGPKIWFDVSFKSYLTDNSVEVLFGLDGGCNFLRIF